MIEYVLTLLWGVRKYITMLILLFLFFTLGFLNAGIGVGAIGFSLAVLSSTIIASSLVFSLYLCANTCNISDEEIFEECI